MKFKHLAATLAASTAAPVLAQATTVPSPAVTLPNAQVVPGATVYGPQGEVVGTVTQIANGVATLDTGSHKVPMPVTALSQGTAGPTLTITQTQLHQLVEQQHAAGNARRDAALVAGAIVLTADDQPLGTIEAVSGDNVVVLRGPARRIALQRQYFVADSRGLTTRLTLQDIDNAVARAAGG